MGYTFDDFFLHMNDLAVFRDEERRINRVNTAFIRVFGGQPMDWEGRHFDGAALGAQIGAFHNTRAYGQVRVGRQSYWIEWDEAKLPDGGSISIGRLNADRRTDQRRQTSPEQDRRRNTSRVNVPDPAVNHVPPPASIAPSPNPACGQDAKPDDAAPPPLLEPSPEAAQFTILLVEDDPLSAKLATALLERENCVVIHATDGRMALDLAQKRTFDMVLMDMRMPYMDGPTACRHIRALGGAWSEIPIVALTANAFEEDRRTCLNAGMTGFVTKPIDAQTLIAARERWAQAPNQVKTA